MWIRRASDIASSEITPEPVYRNRRQFMIAASGLLASTSLAGYAQSKRGPYDATETITSY